MHILINTNIKSASPTFFGTRVPFFQEEHITNLKTKRCDLSEDGTRVQKRVGEARLIYVLMKNEQLFDIIKWCKLI